MSEGLKVSANNFKEKVLESNVPVLVDFWAEWCGPCRAIGPSIEQLATEYDGKAVVVKLDVDSDPTIASEYNVMSIPALLVFKAGKVVDQMVGAQPKEQIARMIDRSL